jgi:hypothetical protein
MCHNESLYDNCEHDYAGEEIEESHYRTGLRAQIAVLEECVEELNGFSWAQLKIAALRKELEG